MRAAYDEGPPPYELMLGLLCARFPGRFPEEIEAQDWASLMIPTDAADLFGSFKKKQAGQKVTIEENARIGELLDWDLQQQKQREQQSS